MGPMEIFSYVVLGMFALGVYYAIIFMAFLLEAYTYRKTLLLDLIPFMGLFRAGVPALIYQVTELISDLRYSWNKLEKQ